LPGWKKKKNKKRIALDVGCLRKRRLDLGLTPWPPLLKARGRIMLTEPKKIFSYPFSFRGRGRGWGQL
jgi:hypothetical protein